MPLAELIPTVRGLTRPEKIHLIQMLAEELAKEEAFLQSKDTEYPVWSPHDSYEAAAVLQRCLDNAKAPS